MDYKFRCDCPITSSLDVLGDKWMLVIIKQMLFEGKETFKDFVESDESIATNILSSKLKYLEQLELVQKTDHSTNKKTKLYHLTDKALGLTPILIELALWSDEYLRRYNTIMRNPPELELMKTDKTAFIQTLQEAYKAKRPQ